jgi:zinc and cadmium transporter
MNVLLPSLAALLTTAIGGLLALLLRERLASLAGFATGIVLGVVCFELLPQGLALARQLGDAGWAAALAAAAGYLTYHGLERAVPSCGASCPHRWLPGMGLLAGLALSGHSVLDGIGVGVAVQLSPGMGLAAAAAVVAHDFGDGLATVSLMLRYGHSTRRAAGMLALNALAPLIGAALTLAFRIPWQWLAPVFAFFAGFLLCAGTSALLSPRRGGPCRLAPTLAGASLVFLLTRLGA